MVTLTMVLKKSGYKDVTVSGKVTIKGLSFTFGPLVTSNGTISTAELLSAVNGMGKAGYALKSISSLDAKYGSVNGTAPGLSIVLTKKQGDFTADLLLKKSGQLDVWIRGANFSYVSGGDPAPKDIKWKPTALNKLWSSGGSFTVGEILGNVAGTTTGYDLKTIANISDSDVAEVSGKTINFKKKAGSFTADLILVHATQSDIRLGNATFDITKRTKESLTFDGLSKPYVLNGAFSAVDIFAKVQTTAKKVGYRIKEIKDLSPDDVVTISADKRSLSFYRGQGR